MNDILTAGGIEVDSLEGRKTSEVYSRPGEAVVEGQATLLIGGAVCWEGSGSHGLDPFGHFLAIHIGQDI